jgi:polyadenylate-binding protein
VTRRSLGYAYVNFHNVQDAERALDTMNFTEIKGRPCRIMWSQRDPSLRKSGVGNVFVKNLAPTVDNKGLFDTFSVFGNILSCKVATDESGSSKGYGYVHYETAEAAQDAIQKFNGNFIDEYEVNVGPFVRRQDRAGQADWTNLYVKQFPESYSEDQLKEVFSPFGTVASVIITRDAEGKSKGFGFVNYAEHPAAEKALAELANKSIEDPATSTSFELYVNRAQKKSERSREIKGRLDALNQERVSKYQGMNLYVKNLDDSINDEFFRETFAQFGTITSARIMRDTADTSKGFGFICYSSPEEATRAVTEMNGKILRSKPVVVTLHQRKELRRAHLAQTYAPRGMNRAMNYPPGPGGMPMPYMGMYAPQGGPNFPQGQGGRGQPFPFPGGQFPPRGASPRGMPFPGRGGPGFYPMPPYAMPPQQMQAGQMQGQNGFKRMPNGQPMGPGGPGSMQPGARRGGPTGGRGLGGRGPMGPGQMAPPSNVPMGGAQLARGAVKFNSNVRNQGGPQMAGAGPMGGPQQQAPQPVPVPGLGEPLDDQALAAADPQMQKNMIGERLYPLIYVHQPNLAGKITGMLLEMDNAELLNLLESPDALMHKIDEALIVLKNHAAAEE